MNFQKGRVKSRFLTLLREKYDVVNNARMEILNSLADKDKEKKPIIEDGQFKLSAENRKKFDAEYIKLMNEECVIDVLPSVEKDIAEIKQLMNNSPVELTDQQNAECESIMEALNSISKKEEKSTETKKKAKGTA